MASWCPSVSEAMSELDRDIPRYLSCVETIREECGHDPQWSNAGEFIPDESVYVPKGWERRQPTASVPVTRQKSWRPKEEENGA